MTNKLIQNGVTILNPSSVHVSSDINAEMIHPETVIHPGCRISGPGTSIGPGCVLGEEGPTTLINCQLEKNVRLKGGSFAESTFLKGVSCGPSAHIRPVCLMEEHSSTAHCAGLKHTMLMPYVTLGSLINFCDCLMAGGTGKSSHSEVGSSFVHFNFTTRQDKATPSLIGDVPRGVMLDQPPIFLGGQGGIVGPVRIEYGTVTAAGSICRRDITEKGKLLAGGLKRHGLYDYDPRTNPNLEKIITNNLFYIGNLAALLEWYRHVRTEFMNQDPFRSFCCRGAIEKINVMISERKTRLSTVTDLNLDSLPGPEDIEPQARDMFLECLASERKDSYLETIKNLSPETKAAGTAWLNSIVSAFY